MSKSVVEELKKINKESGHKELFRHLIYCHFSWRLVSLLIRANINISPNMITLISTILGIIAAVFYYRADYASLVIGTIILNFSYIVDCMDGELARYKKISSIFGAWLDSVCDMIVEFAVLAGLTLGLYFKTGNYIILIIGFFAVANLMMVLNIRNLSRIHFDIRAADKNIKPSPEFKIAGRFIGGAELFTVSVTVMTLLNQVYYLLWICAALGTLVWVKQIFRRIITHHEL